MPFGLATAPATFHSAMELLLAGLTYSICLCYLDDVIIFSNSIAKHRNQLSAVLSRFQQHNLHLNLSKTEIPVPTTIKEVGSFLRLSGYYRRFIKNYGTISAPLTKLTTKTHTNQFNWTAECQHAFKTFQARLCNSPVVVHPNFHKEFMLQTCLRYRIKRYTVPA